MSVKKELQQQGKILLLGELSVQVTRKDGSTEPLVIVSRDEPPQTKKWRRDYHWLKSRGLLAPFVTFALYVSLVLSGGLLGVVTDAGVAYMADDFDPASASHIGNFKYHDSGTGANAEAVGDTALQTPTGGARVVGTFSNPSANIFRSVASIPYTSTLTITEWGLFSAAAGVTLWDRRVWAGTAVTNGDSITFTYNLTINSGG